MGSEPSAMRQNRDGIQLRSPAIFRGEPFGTESSASACSRCPHALEHSAETRIGSQAFVCRIVCDLDRRTGMLCEGRVEPAQGIDRKSTRLNSSHGYISYAVFCLKKKKN